MEKVLCPVVYLIDKDSFFFIEQADRIPAILSAARVYNYSRNDIFLIYASSCRNETPLPDELRLIQLADTERNARNFDTLHFCLKFIIYVEFFDQSQRVVVTPHSKRTLESHEAKILNNSGLYVTLVDTLWNTELMFINGTMVKGLFRWQRYGTGRKKTRYIYIAPFYRGAYKRRPDPL